LKRRYQLVLLREDARRSLLRLIPRQSIDRGRFAWAEVALGRQTARPEALRLVAPNGKDTQTYTLREVERDAEVDPKSFEGTIPAGWSVVALGPDGAPRRAAPQAGAGAGPAGRR
jgi:hypothetical protein